MNWKQKFWITKQSYWKLCWNVPAILTIHKFSVFMSMCIYYPYVYYEVIFEAKRHTNWGQKMQVNGNNDNIMTEGHNNGGFMSLIRKHWRFSLNNIVSLPEAISLLSLMESIIHNLRMLSNEQTKTIKNEEQKEFRSGRRCKKQTKQIDNRHIHIQPLFGLIISGR